MNYRDHIDRARRLAILQVLYFAPGYTLGRLALRASVEATGYITSSDKLAAELTWLTEMGLVELLELDSVRVTDRGVDIALGRSDNPGVARPLPGGRIGG